MEKFVKLFESAKYGQICVMRKGQDASDAAEIRFYVKPDGLGVCSVAIEYGDDEAGWDLSEKMFQKIEQENAEGAVKGLFEILNPEQDAPAESR